MEEKYGEVLFYRSEDLHTWTYVNKAWKGPEYGWMWECPDYFETEGGGVLLLSAMGFLKNDEKAKNQSLCFPVTFDESECRLQIPDQYQYLDYGLDLYAPQTALDKDGRRIMTAWLRMPKVTAEGWIGMFCSPRVVERKDRHIYFRMHPNIRSAYSRIIRDTAEASEDGYMAAFELEDGETINIGGFLITRKGNRIITDRTKVYPANVEGAHLISETPEIRDGFRLEVLVDSNLIEVYINDGEYVISNAVYDLEDKISCSTDKALRLSTTGNKE